MSVKEKTCQYVIFSLDMDFGKCINLLILI